MTPKEWKEAQLAKPDIWESILGAVARGWCYEENANKTMDSELAVAIAKEVHALYTTPPRCPNCDSLERQNAELDLRLAEQDQAPFGFLTNKRQRFNFEPNATGLSNMPMTIDWKIPLYGSPQPQRKPLTDEQKLALCKQFPDHLTFNAIEAIEAAHGIKE